MAHNSAQDMPVMCGIKIISARHCELCRGGNQPMVIEQVKDVPVCGSVEIPKDGVWQENP